MYLECEGVYLVLIALALACIAACHLPFGSAGARNTVAGVGTVLAAIAALLALVC